MMARAGPVTNGLSVPVTWWGQLITGWYSFCICMAESTPDFPSEVGSPKFWRGFFFFQTRETRSGWWGKFERDRERTQGKKGKGQKTKMGYKGDEWSHQMVAVLSRLRKSHSWGSVKNLGQNNEKHSH